MKTNTTLTLRCSAKVNLALSVGGAKPDGYHPIASWMVMVDFHDELTVDRIDGQSRYDIDWAPDAPQPSEIDWAIESDLMVKAQRLMEKRVGHALPVHATLSKRIPVGAGLAGGSTDGVGMFKAIRQLYDLKLTDENLIAMSMEIGSDLAFFFSSGSAIVTGRGDVLEETPLAKPIHLCLIMPNFGCPTGAVYRAFDQLSPGNVVDEQAVRACAASDPVKPFNDLTKAACRVQPRLMALMKQAGRLTGREVHITGSGAGMFIVADDLANAKTMADQIHGEMTLATRAVSTAGVG